MSALGQKQTFAAQNGMSALPPIATSIAYFGMSAMGQKRTFCPTGVASDQLSGTRQHNPDLGELAGLCVNLNCARMLLDDDVMADGEAEASALSGRFGRKEWLKHLFFHVRRYASAVVTDPDFHTITKVSSRGCERRLVVAPIGFSSAPGRSIKAVCNQIKKSPPDVLRKNVCPTSRWIKGLLELDLKPLRLGPRSVPGKIEAFLNKRIDINHPMLT